MSMSQPVASSSSSAGLNDSDEELSNRVNQMLASRKIEADKKMKLNRMKRSLGLRNPNKRPSEYRAEDFFPPLPVDWKPGFYYSQEAAKIAKTAAAATAAAATAPQTIAAATVLQEISSSSNSNNNNQREPVSRRTLNFAQTPTTPTTTTTSNQSKQRKSNLTTTTTPPQHQIEKERRDPTHTSSEISLHLSQPKSTQDNSVMISPLKARDSFINPKAIVPNDSDDDDDDDDSDDQMDLKSLTAKTKSLVKEKSQSIITEEVKRKSSATLKLVSPVVTRKSENLTALQAEKNKKTQEKSLTSSIEKHPTRLSIQQTEDNMAKSISSPYKTRQRASKSSYADELDADKENVAALSITDKNKKRKSAQTEKLLLTSATTVKQADPTHESVSDAVILAGIIPDQIDDEESSSEEEEEEEEEKKKEVKVTKIPVKSFKVDRRSQRLSSDDSEEEVEELAPPPPPLKPSHHHVHKQLSSTLKAQSPLIGANSTRPSKNGNETPGRVLFNNSLRQKRSSLSQLPEENADDQELDELPEESLLIHGLHTTGLQRLTDISAFVSVEKNVSTNKSKSSVDARLHHHHHHQDIVISEQATANHTTQNSEAPAAAAAACDASSSLIIQQFLNKSNKSNRSHRRSLEHIQEVEQVEEMAPPPPPPPPPPVTAGQSKSKVSSIKITKIIPPPPTPSPPPPAPIQRHDLTPSLKGPTDAQRKTLTHSSCSLRSLRKKSDDLNNTQDEAELINSNSQLLKRSMVKSINGTINSTVTLSSSHSNETSEHHSGVTPMGISQVFKSTRTNKQKTALPTPPLFNSDLTNVTNDTSKRNSSHQQQQQQQQQQENMSQQKDQSTRLSRSRYRHSDVNNNNSGQNSSNQNSNNSNNNNNSTRTRNGNHQVVYDYPNTETPSYHSPPPPPPQHQQQQQQPQSQEVSKTRHRALNDINTNNNNTKRKSPLQSAQVLVEPKRVKKTTLKKSKPPKTTTTKTTAKGVKNAHRRIVVRPESDTSPEVEQQQQQQQQQQQAENGLRRSKRARFGSIDVVNHYDWDEVDGVCGAVRVLQKIGSRPKRDMFIKDLPKSNPLASLAKLKTERDKAAKAAAAAAMPPPPPPPPIIDSPPAVMLTKDQRQQARLDEKIRLKKIEKRRARRSLEAKQAAAAAKENMAASSAGDQHMNESGSEEEEEEEGQQPSEIGQFSTCGDSMINSTQETVLIKDPNSDKEFKRNTYIFTKNLANSKREFKALPGEGTFIHIINNKRGILKIAPGRYSATQVHVIAISYVVQLGECLISIEDLISRQKIGDIVSIPKDHKYKFKNTSKDTDAYLYFTFDE